MHNRMFGPMGFFYWMLILCNILIPQTLWIKRWRQNTWYLFAISLVVNVGMWLERFIIVTSLQRDFVPSAWGRYEPTIWDWTMFLGTIGLFLNLLFLFIRMLPMISISEMQALLPEAAVQEREP